MELTNSANIQDLENKRNINPGYFMLTNPVNYGQNHPVTYVQNHPATYGQNHPVNYGQNLIPESSNLALLDMIIESKKEQLRQACIGNAQRKMTKFDEIWNKRYAELMEFRMTKGHCNVPQRYPDNKALGKWVHKQRIEYKRKIKGEKSHLSNERMIALENIGFEVYICKRAEGLWHERFQELLNFHRDNGHCNVPQQYEHNKALGKWVHRQKHEFRKVIDGKPSYLTAHRFQALLEVGLM